MKLNIANSQTGLQKIVEVDDEKKLLPFFEKRMGAEVPGDSIGDEFKGYSFRITGGNDKQGFPMLQGILSNTRVRILFKKGMKCYRPRRSGERKRKSVRGCIVNSDLAVMSLVMVKKGNEEIPGLTDGEKPRRKGPKRANKIRKLFNLTKEDDVKQYVVRRTLEGKKKKYKAPKIQRLVTDERLQRKRRLKAMKLKHVKNSQENHKKYLEIVSKFRHDQKEKRAQAVAKKKKLTLGSEEAKKTIKKEIKKGLKPTKKKSQPPLIKRVKQSVPSTTAQTKKTTK